VRRAVAAAVATLSLIAGGSPPAIGVVSDPAQQVVEVKAIRPTIVWAPIPFGDTRKRQTAGYSFRHYGERTWRLEDPRMIVQHYTAGTTWGGAWNTFAANTEHNGEYPGTCAHFLIDSDGTIRQLVPLWVRCRHAVGMNYTSIGIEHVGTSDRMVLDDREQMRASLRLTAWLMAKYDIDVGNVIGHRETLDSPYRLELYPDWWCLVHADFPRPAMKEYRTRLRDVLVRWGVPAGAGPGWVDNGC
jgi:beta-N-acetylhexosaminidase